MHAPCQVVIESIPSPFQRKTSRHRLSLIPSNLHPIHPPPLRTDNRAHKIDPTIPVEIAGAQLDALRASSRDAHHRPLGCAGELAGWAEPFFDHAGVAHDGPVCGDAIRELELWVCGDEGEGEDEVGSAAMHI
jgi:hypothetical protein